MSSFESHEGYVTGGIGAAAAARFTESTVAIYNAATGKA